MPQKERAQKEEQVKLLLADSIIDDILKDTLLENISNFTEKELDGLLKSLKAEQKELKKGINKIDKIGKAGDKEWKKLEKAQDVAAAKAVDDAIDDVIADVVAKKV
jgi:hypothetical protein